MSRSPLRKRLPRAIRAMWQEMTGHGRTAYDGAGMHRLLSDWVALAMSADDEIKGDLTVLRSRARELARNNSYAKRYFRLLVNNVVGPTGIGLQAKIIQGDGLDRETNAAIEASWNEWAREPVSVDGKQTLRQFEILLLKTLACDGETFVRLYRGHPTNRYGLALQFVDADLVDHRFNREPRAGKNEIRMGVEIDKFGAPVGYWIWDKPPSVAIASVRKRYFVAATDMRHIYVQDRVNQTRGVTWVHSVMVPAHMLDAYEQTEAVAARIGASKMGFIQKQEGAIGSGLASKKTPARMEASPGTFELLADGYEAKFWDPAHPTGQFASFVKQLLRKIASGFSVGYNVLANDAEGVSYSTMRSFALIERDDWRVIQEDLVDGWRTQLYRDWLGMALLTGSLKLGTRDPRLYMAVRHRPRGWPWVDPEKEVKASSLAIGNGLDSRTSVLAGKGVDIDDLFKELAEEKALAESYGISITADGPAEETKTKAEWEAENEEDVDGGDGEDRGASSASVGFL